ncbi:hypothetical protein BC828DRAFT_416720 [Blastocladiella britannica]|nr:hypothetical protein BC828DRAFT_416720 [Blastocladiella britannica]
MAHPLAASVADLLAAGSSVVSADPLRLPLHHESDGDWDDAVPLDGMWAECIATAGALDPNNLALLPPLLVSAGSIVPHGFGHHRPPPLDNHFYLLVSSVTDLGGNVVPPTPPLLPARVWQPLWPRVLSDLVARSARWPLLAPDRDEPIDMEAPLVAVAEAIVRCGVWPGGVLACPVDEPDMAALLAALHASRGHRHLEQLHDALMRLLLYISDAHLSSGGTNNRSGVGSSTPTTSSTNTVLLQLLSRSAPGSHVFAENLVYLINRSDTPADLVLALKPSYVLLITHPDLFFTNDLRVLADVVVRRLRNGVAHAVARNALVRVLDRLVEIPAAIVGGGDASMVVATRETAEGLVRVFEGVDPTTVRIARRILGTLASLSS